MCLEVHLAPESEYSRLVPAEHPDVWRRFREAVVAERERRGWNQERLASEAQIARPTLSRIESGRTATPDRDTVEKLADALGLNVDALFGSSSPPDEPVPEIALDIARERLPGAPREVLEAYVRKLSAWRRLNDELEEIRSRWSGPQPRR